MPQLIEVPGEGLVEFPDSMTDEQIAAVLRGEQGRTLIQAATAPFLTALETVREQARAVERGEVPQAPDPFRAAGGVFPGSMAAIGAVTELARRALPSALPAGSIVGATEGYAGEETTAFPREAAAELLGMVAGGGAAMAGKRFMRGIEAIRAPGTPAGPPPELAKALPPGPDVIPAPGAVRTFAAGPSTEAGVAELPYRAEPLERLRQSRLPRKVTVEADRIERTQTYPIGKTPQDVATKAALVNQAERPGPRVTDPVTGEPVFPPTERIGTEVGEAALTRPWPGVKLGGEEGARTQPASYRQPKVFELPEDTPLASVTASRTPPVVEAARVAERPFPPETARTRTLGDYLWEMGERALARSVRERAPTGLSPAEVIRRFNLLNLVTTSDPAVAKMVNAGQRGAEEYGQWLHRWQQLGEQVARDAVGNPLSERVLDKATRIMQRHQENTLEAFRQIQREMPEALPAMRAWRQLNDKLGPEAVRRGRLKPEDLRYQNYVPLWRDKTVVGEKLLLQIDNYFPVYIENAVPKAPRLAFQKARSLGTAPDLGFWDTWRLQGAAMGRMFAIDDVFMPVVRAELGNVSQPFMKLARVIVNNHLGVPGYTREAPREISRLLKTFASGRTLALSPSSPLHNMTQMLNTFADSTTREFASGLRGLADEQMWQLARKRGVISSFTKADMDRAAEFGSKVATQLSRGITQATTWSLGMFRGSEQVLRVQAFATGMAQAAGKGLAGEKALQHASDFVRRNQFALGAETGIFTQFKPYVTGQTIRLASYAKEAEAGAELLLRGIASGKTAMLREGLSRLRGPAKYWTGATVLFGGDVTGANWAIEGATEQMFGEEGRYKMKGLLPAIGITMANQVALGALPLQSVRDALFFLPGPFMAGVADAISAGTYWTMEATGVRNPDGGLGFRVSPGDMATGDFGRGFRPEDVGEVTARATRAFPGVQVNRVREFFRALANSGYDMTGEEQVRLPTSVSEAAGLEQSKGELIREAGAEEKFLRLFGLGVEQAEEEREARQRVQQRERDVADTRTSAATFFKAGQIDRTFAELDKLTERHGLDAALQAMGGLPEAIVTAYKNDAMTRLQRQVLTGPQAGLPGRLRAAQEPRSIERAVGRALLGE